MFLCLPLVRNPKLGEPLHLPLVRNKSDSLEIHICLPVVTSHFFIFFCSTIGAITPPVALAAYAAAAIARSEVTATGFTAFRLGIAGYLIPFLVMYRPELMMIGPWGKMVVSLLVSLAIILATAFGMQMLAHLWGKVAKRSAS